MGLNSGFKGLISPFFKSIVIAGTRNVDRRIFRTSRPQYYEIWELREQSKIEKDLS